MDALLVIDVQVGAFDGVRDVPLADPDRFLAALLELVALARSCSVPVVFVQDCGRVGGAYEAGTPHWELHPALAPFERVVRKTHGDAFRDTDLVAHLADVDTVVLAGQRSEACVWDTALGALAAGWSAVLASDAHASQDGEVSAEARRADVERRLEARGVRCLATEALRARWGQRRDRA
jgi:nicotinamidase-related amidase